MSRPFASLVMAAGLFLGALCIEPGTALAARSESFAKPDAQGTVDVATSKPAHTLVVLMSGDGGWWGDIDAQLANRIAHAGYAVVGLDTNVWFTDERTPQQVADHLADLVKTYMAKTQAQKYVLIGYSFGADMLAPAYARMNEQLENEAGSLIMLSPGKMASFQVNVMEETGMSQGNYDLSPDFTHLPKALTVCMFGENEQSDTGCKDPAMSGASLVTLPGGHHYNHNMTILNAQILNVLKSKTPA